MSGMDESLSLHLGCGKTLLPGFINIDIDACSGADRLMDIRDLEFGDASVDLIYASHVLEHFGRHEVNLVLKEWARVLKPGGMLRVAVPDFSKIATYYLENGKTSDLLGLVMGGQKDEFDFHKMIFDFRSLQDTLFLIGFADVQRWDWREVSHGAFDDYSQAYLPHMDKENGLLMSLNIEARKL